MDWDEYDDSDPQSTDHQSPLRNFWTVFCLTLLGCVLVIGAIDVVRMWLGLETMDLIGLAKALLGCALTALLVGLSWLSGQTLGKVMDGSWLIRPQEPQ